MRVDAVELTKEKRVNDISFTLETGRIAALIGENGAGKTTLLHMLAGLLRPTKGTVHFSDTKEDARTHIGFLPQYPAFHEWMTAKEFLHYAGELSGKTKKAAESQAGQLLERVGLLDTGRGRINTFSGGMKQRLGIAQALIGDPQLLLLDEPVSALDPKGRNEVMNLLQCLKGERTILYSTHVLHDAEQVCDDVLMLHKGKLVKSTSLKDLLAKTKNAGIMVEANENLDALVDQLKKNKPLWQLETSEHVLTASAADGSDIRQAFLQELLMANVSFSRVTAGRQTLESVFQEVVGNARI